VAGPPVDAATIARYHRYTREHGPSIVLGLVMRVTFLAFLLTYNRLRRSGREHVPAGGALVVVSNHRSFLDPLLVNALLPWRRQRDATFMCKAEMFRKRWHGWLFSRLGGYPVRRGAADPEALETARRVLERGGVVVMFPEGTWLRHQPPGEPRRGAARLALATGASLLPVSLYGAEAATRGGLPRPARIDVRAGTAQPVARAEPTPAAAERVMADAWAVVRELYATQARLAAPREPAPLSPPGRA